MISGALILNKDYSFKEIFYKVIRILIALLSASLFYYIAKTIEFNFNQFNLIDFFKITYSSKVVIPLWYLYAYMAFLIMVPFLRILVKHMDNNYYKYLLCLGIVFGVGRGLIAAFTGQWSNSDFSILFLESTIYYPLLGYFIENVIDMKKIKKNKVLVLVIILFISVFASVIFNYYQIQKTNNLLDQSFLSTFNYIHATIIYFIVKYISVKILNFSNHKLFSNIICTIGTCTFGIYLLEDALRSKIYWKVLSKILPIVNGMVASLFSIICCIIVGVFIVLILKKIPYIKKLL